VAKRTGLHGALLLRTTTNLTDPWFAVDFSIIFPDDFGLSTTFLAQKRAAIGFNPSYVFRQGHFRERPVLERFDVLDLKPHLLQENRAQMWKTQHS